MTNVGWSTLDVIPSVKNLRSELDRQTRADFAAAGRRGGQQFGDAAGREAGSRFKTQMSPILRNVFAPAAGVLAGAGIIQGFKSVVGAASEAEQAVGGVRAVFKDYADEVIRDSERAEQGLGLSTAAYQQLVTVTGALLKNKGLTDFADQAENLLKIGADLAAQYGGPTSQAVEALNAALRGESDPIERYAISLNETAVNAVLAANGQKNLTGAALEQAKTQARLTLITQQSADAQGAFTREADTFGGAAARTSAHVANMRAELGEKFLPAMQATTSFINNQGLPALEATGGVVADAANAFADLPAPVKAATGALVAFRLAQAAGVGTGIAAGFGSLSSGLESVRIRGMLAADTFRTLRAGQLQIVNGSGTFTPAVGRMAASLGALQAGAAGAAAGLRRGLSGALGLVGGPWGAAFIAGTAVLTHFWQEHKEAQQRVEEFTATLDKQTGAVTENSREWAAKRLLDEGVLDNAQRLGISLDTVTSAALGQKDALREVNAELDRLIAAGTAESRGGRIYSEDAKNARTLQSVLNDTNGTVRQGSADQRLLAAALGRTDAATGQTAAATESYAGRLDEARKAVRDLLDAENARRNKMLGAFQDETQIAQALRSAREEAAEGAKTLDLNRKAGLENRDALAALASAWNDSANKVKNAKGAYDDMRKNFIDLAEKMGASEGQAKKLADQLLGVPRKTPAEVTTPGMDAALERVRELNRELRLSQRLSRIIISAQATNVQANLEDIRGHAGGGLLSGPGTGTSDSFLIRASDGEFMQRRRAVDYYGVDFMRRLNALQVPRFANGGPVGVQTSGGSGLAGQEIVGVLRLAADGTALIDGVVRRGIDESEAAYVRQRRQAAIGGMPV